MKKIITLLAVGTISIFMQACTTYGEPYSSGYYSAGYYSSPAPRYYAPTPPPMVIHQNQYHRPRAYTYDVLDIQANTMFRVQDRRQPARQGCNPKPTFFYVP
jgi:hypothetical protein